MSVKGIPLLYRVLKSVSSAGVFDEIMVATTDLPEDDPIESTVRHLGFGIYRGSALNVLDRFSEASEGLKETDTVVRFTADNPWNHPEITRHALKIHAEESNDYTCIDGLSHVVPEFIRVRALRDLARNERTDAYDQEHVTPFFRKNPTRFKTRILPSDFGGLRHDLDKYLTIDNQDDLSRFESMIEKVDIEGKGPDFKKVYEWLDAQIPNLKTGPALKERMSIKLAGVPIGDGFPYFIIAEIGQNHNGDVKLAKKMIDMAARCGANAVKFQKRDIPSELTKDAFNAPYDNPVSFGKTYGEHRMFLELNEEQHQELKDFAISRGITYFCTPCDIPSLEMMERIGCPFYKVASRDLTNIPLLERMGRTGKPILISTGMSGYEEIEDALKALNRGPDSIVIMHCTSEYPCRLENVNLLAIKKLREKYGHLVGYSDHTSGIIVSVGAAMMGACVLEKHVTLDRTMKGTDQAGSLEEYGLYKLVDYIRAIEKAFGDEEKVVLPATSTARAKLARSVTSKVKIGAGATLTEEMLTLKSPGTGLKWSDRHLLLGKKAKIDIDPDCTLRPESFH
jgi:sialic acid synthase SpsE/spore coat polysaccharide biosynthesis protein SpsF (cytidylyltransferase family)